MHAIILALGYGHTVCLQWEGHTSNGTKKDYKTYVEYYGHKPVDILLIPNQKMILLFPHNTIALKIEISR